MGSDFDTVGKATIAELCLGLAFLRGGTLERARSEIEAWFEASFSSAEASAQVLRMVECDVLLPHPARAGGYLLSEKGEEMVERVLRGLILFIDAGEGRWDVGRMFQVIKTAYDKKRN